jgi:hypothetical protein
VSPGKRRILVVVHPDSACGSADFNLIGEGEAVAQRRKLAAELDGWIGEMWIVDGFAPGDLRKRRYAPLATALRRASERCVAAGFRVDRRSGPADSVTDHRAVAMSLANARRATADTEIVVTGAWYNSERDDGCVADVAVVLRGIGCHVRIGDGAVRLKEGPDAELAVVFPIAAAPFTS